MLKTITTAEQKMSAQSVHTDNTVDTCANRQKWYEVWQSTWGRERLMMMHTRKTMNACDMQRQCVEFRQ